MNSTKLLLCMSVILDHSFALSSAFIDGAGAVASVLIVTLPVLSPSPKKMTSTVRSSLMKRQYVVQDVLSGV